MKSWKYSNTYVLLIGAVSFIFGACMSPTIPQQESAPSTSQQVLTVFVPLKSNEVKVEEWIENSPFASKYDFQITSDIPNESPDIFVIPQGFIEDVPDLARLQRENRIFVSGGFAVAVPSEINSESATDVISLSSQMAIDVAPTLVISDLMVGFPSDVNPIDVSKEIDPSDAGYTWCTACPIGPQFETLLGDIDIAAVSNDEFMARIRPQPLCCFYCELAQP